MNEISVMFAVVGVLVVVAAGYALVQIRTLRRTTILHEMLPDERHFLRRQAWRRLINSGVMLVLAGMIAGSYGLGLQKQADALGQKREQERLDGIVNPMSAEDREFSRFYGAYWIATLLLLGVIVATAGVDLLATRRYGLRKLHQIQADRRAMLQRQLERYRQERDGF